MHHVSMTHIGLLEQAQDCRRRALAHLGQPKATFLLNAAKEFESLDAKKRGLRLIGGIS